MDVVKAEMDKSLLEAAGIPAFIAGENSASIGYGGSIAEIHLQVQDADVDRARQVLQDNKEATPLSDDFIPPAVLPPEKSELEIADPDSWRVVRSVIVTSLVVFAMFVGFGLWKTSHSATAYYRRGFARYVKSDLDGAIADYTIAIDLNFRYVGRAYDGRGLAKRAKGDLEGAIADYNVAVTLDPKDKAAYGNRGSAKWSKGDLDGALADYDSAIELDPNDPRSYDGRSFVKRSKNDLDGALADSDKAIKLDPRYTRAYENRAFTKRLKGDLDGAIADYNRAIDTDPKDANASSGRGFVKRMKGDLYGALADYDRAIELDSKNTDAYYGRGVASYDKRYWSNALSDFRKASALRPTVSKSDTLQDYSHIRIWMTRAKLGERDAATRELKQYLLTRTNGKPGDWPSTVARALTGDVSEGEFLKAADSGDEKQTRNQRCEAYYYAGTLRLIDGDRSAAADNFTKCLATGANVNYEFQSAAAELQFLKGELPSRQN